MSIFFNYNDQVALHASRKGEQSILGFMLALKLSFLPPVKLSICLVTQFKFIPDEEKANCHVSILYFRNSYLVTHRLMLWVDIGPGPFLTLKLGGAIAPPSLEFAPPVSKVLTPENYPLF